MAESGIYEIVNVVNGKRYVGSAVNLKQRRSQHFSALRRGVHHNITLARAWVKYGEHGFEFRVIEWCPPEILIQREQFYIDERAEYNCSPTAGSTLGYRFTDEAKAKISVANKGKTKGRKRDREAVEKTAAAHRGRTRTAETRAKIAEKAKGRKFIRDDAYRAKLSERLKGRPKSPEHMAALQEGRARRVYTEEQKQAASEANKRAYAEGRRSRERSPEYRAKIAATLRERSQSPEVKERLRKQAAEAWAMRSQAERDEHMKKVRAARSK